MATPLSYELRGVEGGYRWQAVREMYMKTPAGVKPYLDPKHTRILVGDVRKTIASIPDRSVNCIVTSPPYYGLRDYGHDDQIGAEDSPESFTSALVEVFRECRRVLRDDGTLWLNLGDSYAGGGGGNYGNGKSVKSQGGQQIANVRNRPGWLDANGLKPKDLIGIPWRVAFALQSDGWYLRQDIIWAKPNSMPESVTDRCTKAHEYLFLLSKSERYYFDAKAIQEQAVKGFAGSSFTEGKTGDHQLGRSSKRPRRQDSTRTSAVPGATDHSGIHRAGTDREPETRNRRSVWTIATQPFSGAHFATFPPALIEPCILAGCPKDGTVLDPFGGAGTTGLVASRLGRSSILCELNPEYAEMAAERIRSESPMFNRVEVVR